MFENFKKKVDKFEEKTSDFVDTHPMTFMLGLMGLSLLGCVGASRYYAKNTAAFNKMCEEIRRANDIELLKLQKNL